MAGLPAVRHNHGDVFDIGPSLREARIKRGLEPADVQKAIRIRDRYLQALEEERWELLPGDAYVKGFLRSYADFLGLDPNLYIDEYNSRFAVEEEQPLAPQAIPKMERAGRSVGWLRPLVVIAAIVAVVAAVAAWQLGGSSNTSQPPPTTTTTSGGTTTTTGKKHPTPPAALPKRAILVASRGPCWLEIREGSAHGTVVYENTLQQGQSLPVDLTAGPVWMTFGDPANLDVHLGGKLAHGLPTQVGAAVLLSRTGLKPA